MPRTTENTGEGRGSGHKGPAKGFAFGVASVTQALHGTSLSVADVASAVSEAHRNANGEEEE